MPYVGNDVVDLKEPANAGKSRDSRFLKKILTDAEIEFVINAGNSNAALWSLWACKETAFKVIKKSFSAAAFVPRRWQTIFTGFKSECSEGEVIIPGKDGIFIRLLSNSDYIHCVGADSLAALDQIIWSIHALPKEETDSSVFSRRCLAQNLAQHFALNLQQIKIRRAGENGELQPPCVYVDGKKTDIDVSLSHDGRFSAFAVYRI